MGLVAGFLSGISATPIVSVVLPLIFALVTAGGGFYVVWGKRDADENVAKEDRAARARFLGVQMLGFGPCFLAGLWLGVYAKFNSDSVWPRHLETVIYPRFSTSSPAVLQYLRSLDLALMRDGVAVGDRNKILQALYDQRKTWENETSDLVEQLKPQPLGESTGAGGEGSGGGHEGFLFHEELHPNRIPLPAPRDPP
jgi:hypothetical protein